MYENLTNIELAGMLEMLRSSDLSYTGQMAMLDEAVLNRLSAHPRLHAAHHAYSEARSYMWPRSRTPEREATLLEAADELARQLRAV
jgi:hypothetical protein